MFNYVKNILSLILQTFPSKSKYIDSKKTRCFRFFQTVFLKENNERNAKNFNSSSCVSVSTRLHLWSAVGGVEEVERTLVRGNRSHQHRRVLNTNRIQEGHRKGRLCTFYFKEWLVYVDRHLLLIVIQPFSYIIQSHFSHNIPPHQRVLNGL